MTNEAPLKDEGGPFFPSEQHETQDGYWNQTFEPGASVRDVFALHAMPALITATTSGNHLPRLLLKRKDESSFSVGDILYAVARDAYDMADAMLAARVAPSEE